MKTKMILGVLILALAGVIGKVHAQEYKKNVVGIHGGLNLAKVDFEGYTPDTKAGFLVGVNYERRLLRFRPFYLETGLEVAQKGCDFDEGDAKLNAMYLQIPLMLKYHFRISERVTLAPCVGGYFAVGIGGHTNLGLDEQLSFDELLSRADYGLRFALAAQWTHFVFTAGYELGLMDINSVELDAAAFGLPSSGTSFSGKMHTRNFFISVGYNF